METQNSNSAPTPTPASKIVKPVKKKYPMADKTLAKKYAACKTKAEKGQLLNEYMATPGASDMVWRQTVDSVNYH